MRVERFFAFVSRRSIEFNLRAATMNRRTKEDGISVTYRYQIVSEIWEEILGEKRQKVVRHPHEVNKR